MNLGVLNVFAKCQVAVVESGKPVLKPDPSMHRSQNFGLQCWKISRERETEKERDLSIQLQPDKMLSTLNSCLGEITPPEKLKVSVTQPVNTRAGFT